MTIQLRTLGQIDLRDDEGNELRSLLTQPKRLAVLVYLASVATTRLCRRDLLLAMFWPESDSERARAALRQALHFIRQAAGADVVIARGADEIGLQADAVLLDSTRLESLADAGRHEEAVALYEGEFLEGFFVRGAPEFERWVSGERDRLRKRTAESAWHVVESRVASGDLTGARRMAERAVRLSSDSEIAVRRFIELLARSGDRAAALAVYREFAEELAAEFGVQPSSETLALVASLSQSLPADVPGATSPALVQTPMAGPQPVTPMRAPRLSGNTPARRSLRGIAALVAVIVLVSALGAMLHSRAWSEKPVMDANRVAVLPFLVQGNSELRYLHDGLPMLLSTRLDGALTLRTVDMRAILLDQSRRGADSLSLQGATDAAVRFGAQLYIVGSVVGSPKGLRVEASLYDALRPGEPLARAQADGGEVDIVSIVDKITTELLANRFRDRGGYVAEMAARTSSSFVALKAWMEGESALARGRYTTAMTSFRAAIEADSTFAMAYYRLSVAAAWAGDLAVVGPAAKKAVELSDRLPPSARMIVEAFLDSRTGRYADAERKERELLRERPTSIDAWFDLGEVLYHSNPARGRPINEAREAFEQLLRMDPSSFAAMSHLARLAAARNDNRALDSLSRNALAGDPDGPHRAELLLLRALSLNEEESRTKFLLMPQELTLLDALWRAGEYTENLKDLQTLALAMMPMAPTQEMRNSLMLLLTHTSLGREQFSLAEQYADSLGARMPRYGGMALSAIALHPAAGAERGRLVSKARAQLTRARATSSTELIYIGSSTRDDQTLSFVALHEALLAIAAGDSASARRMILPSVLKETATRADFLTIVNVALASTPAQRDAALREALAMDVRYGNAYAQQTPLSPRSPLAMIVATMLQQNKQYSQALVRLSTVPEDFGFNLSLLAAVHRRRAEIYSAMGNADAASSELKFAAQILR